MAEVQSAADSTDQAIVFSPSTVTVGTPFILPGEFQGAVDAAKKFAESVNDAELRYKLLEQNSNLVGGTGFEQLTGEKRPDTDLFLPAYNVDLCVSGVACPTN